MKKEKKKRLNLRSIRKSKIFHQIYSLFSKKSNKINSKITKNEKLLASLNSQIHTLLNKNKKLEEKVKYINNLKSEKNQILNKIHLFAGNYEKELGSISKSISDKNQLIKHSVTEKSKKIEEIYRSLIADYKNIGSGIGEIKTKLTELKNKENKKFSEIQNKFSLNELSADGGLDVYGVSFINKINTNKIDLGNVQISNDLIKFSNINSKIMIGNDVITLKELIDTVVLFKKNLQKKCGDNLEKCRPVNKKYFEEQRNKEEEILKNLKNLRQTTHNLIEKGNYY